MPRQPLHSRTGRVSGAGRLNNKAVKVLAFVKFSPSSVSREDIIENTSLSAIEVERQINLLAQLGLISFNSRFPQFPQQGWMVYTKQDKHTVIVNLLRQHGVEDPRTTRTREMLGDYYPTGFELDKKGVQPDRGRTYTQGHPIIPELEFRKETLDIMKKFRDEIKPFRPKEYSLEAVEEKKKKWKWFVEKMNANYEINPTIEFGVFSEDSWYRDGSSANDDNGQSSYYDRVNNKLYITGKFSIVTLLHEYGHSKGFDEVDAIIWSINLGMRVFPVTFNRLLKNSDGDSHMLIRGNQEREFDM